jgi:hypothetical protein|tara:strand:- start:63 stop:359 length:297 start_codon:yes stop_codon:yes gene_type:complete
MLDLLRAASILYGDCSQEAGSSDIYISTGKVSVEQMADIIIKATDLEAEYNSKQYARDRAKLYVSLTEQLDMQYHDKMNGTDTWLDHIKSVKEKYPKA